MAVFYDRLCGCTGGMSREGFQLHLRLTCKSLQATAFACYLLHSAPCSWSLTLPPALRTPPSSLARLFLHSWITTDPHARENGRKECEINPSTNKQSSVSIRNDKKFHPTYTFLKRDSSLEQYLCFLSFLPNKVFCVFRKVFSVFWTWISSIMSGNYNKTASLVSRYYRML